MQSLVLRRDCFALLGILLLQRADVRIQVCHLLVEFSDVDILFVPDYSGKPFTLLTMGGMYLDLRELLGREVDLVVDGSLRPYAVESAERDKQLIYERKS